MPLLKNILKTLAKSVLIPLGLVIQKKMLEPGVTTLIIWNDEMNDLKINKYLEKSGLSTKCTSEIVKGFLGILLVARLLGNLLQRHN